jgi:biotin operon repressor
MRIKIQEGKMTIKKASIIFTLAILEAESEYSNPISQSKIAQMLTEAGIPCDRKTVGRDMKTLQKIGYPVKRTSKGFYLQRKIYTLEEVSFVAKCIENSDNTKIDKTDLIQRLKKTMGHAYAWMGK